MFGQKIRYVEAGHGSVILLLHALGADLTDWRLNVAALAQGHRVIAFDSIGSGLSDKPGIAYRPSTLIDFTIGFMDALEVERAALVGHSFGGAIAAGVALAHAERVERLVLVASGYGYALPDAATPEELGFVPGTLRYIFPTNLEQTRQLLLRVIADSTKADDSVVVAEAFTQALRAGYLMAQIHTAFVNRIETLDGRLGAISMPTLIVWGRKDGITPFFLGERFRSEIPGAKLLAFEDAAHFPVPPFCKNAPFLAMSQGNTGVHEAAGVEFLLNKGCATADRGQNRDLFAKTALPR